MKALISPNEPFATGCRVAEVAGQAFDVAPPLFWVDCSDDVAASEVFYDPQDQSIKPLVLEAPSEPTP